MTTINRFPKTPVRRARVFKGQYFLITSLSSPLLLESILLQFRIWNYTQTVQSSKNHSSRLWKMRKLNGHKQTATGDDILYIQILDPLVPHAWLHMGGNLWLQENPLRTSLMESSASGKGLRLQLKLTSCRQRYHMHVQ